MTRSTAAAIIIITIQAVLESCVGVSLFSTIKLA